MTINLFILSTLCIQLKKYKKYGLKVLHTAITNLQLVHTVYIFSTEKHCLSNKFEKITVSTF